MAAALGCAIYLSVALTFVGLNKFYYVLAGGRKFATFPDLESQLGISLSYIALGVLYLVWLFGTEAATFSRFTQPLQRSAIFIFLSFLSFPLGGDIFLYLHAGLMNLTGVNPFLVRAAAFTTVLSPYVDWGQTSTYGPISQLFFTLSAAFIAISPILAVYFFKVICLAIHILNGYLIWRLLPGSLRSRLTLAYLLHPLLLMEQVGSAHVDVFISTSLLLLATSLLKQRSGFASISLWGGFLSKTIPMIWMPLVGIYLIRQRQWQQLLGAVALSVGLAALLWATVLPGDVWRSLLNPGVEGQFMASIHALVRSQLGLVRAFFPTALTLAEEKFLLQRLTQYTLMGFAIFYAWIALRGFRQRSYTAENVLEDIGWVTMVLFMFATPWVMPWYASILLALAFVLPNAPVFGITTLMLCFSSSTQYLFQGHHSLRSFTTIAIPTIAFILATRLLEGRSVPVPESATTVNLDTMQS